MADPTPADIRSRVVSGLKWKVLSQATIFASRFAVVVILARLLTPREFGLAAMVLVFATLGLLLTDLALGAALIQRRTLTEADRSTVFWVNVLAGTVCAAAGVGLSWPLAAFYGEPQVQPLFALLSVGFLVTAFGTTQSALLGRELHFRAIELRLMIATICGGVVGVVVALQGGGAWAIVLQSLATSTVSTALLWALSDWRPGFGISLDSLRSLGGFGWRVFATRLLFYANRNGDNLLIGRFLGAAPLGAYALAYNLVFNTFGRLTVPFQDLMFPALSRLQGDRARMASAWLRANRIVAGLSLPTLFGLAAVAPDAVPLVFGAQWREAVPVVQILAWVGSLQALQRLNAGLLQALDRTQTLLRFSVVSFVGNVIAFGVGLRWGIVGVAAAFAIWTTLIQPVYATLSCRAVGLRGRDALANVRGIAEASTAMAACVVAERALLVRADVAPVTRLGLCIATGLAVFLPLCAWRSPKLAREVRHAVAGARSSWRSRRLGGRVPALAPIEETQPNG